jgi:hypothetical protein
LPRGSPPPALLPRRPLQKLTWAEGSGSGPLIKAKSPPPSPAPPLSEDDIYGTVPIGTGNKGPSTMLKSGGSNAAAATTAGAAHAVLALLLAVLLALAAHL